MHKANIGTVLFRHYIYFSCLTFIAFQTRFVVGIWFIDGKTFTVHKTSRTFFSLLEPNVIIIHIDTVRQIDTDGIDTAGGAEALP